MAQPLRDTLQSATGEPLIITFYHEFEFAYGMPMCDELLGVLPAEVPHPILKVAEH